MIIILLQDDQIAAEIDLDQGERIIGRDESCKVQLEDPSVSPVHAKLYTANGQAFISDLGSEVGTMVNATKIDSPVELAEGDTVQIGDFIFGVQIVGAATPASEPVTQEPVMPSDETATSTAKNMGKRLMNLALASAREAGRGARLASLKTQMEKLKHVDLSSAFAALGAKAYELKLFADRCGALYGEIDNLDHNIATKREGVTAADDAGFAEKAKAKALSMKGKAEAEALNLKRKSKFAEVGKIVYELNPDNEALKPLLDNVTAINDRIEKLSSEYDEAAANSEGRDAFMSSAKDIGTNATKAAESRIWKKPVVWAAIVAVLLAGYGLRSCDRSGQIANSLEDNTVSKRSNWFNSTPRLLDNYGVNEAELLLVDDYENYTRVQRQGAFKELWDRALQIEHKPNSRALFMRFPDGLSYELVDVIDGTSDGNPVFTAYFKLLETNWHRIKSSPELSAKSKHLNLSSPRLTATLDDDLVKNLRKGEILTSDGWIALIVLGKRQEYAFDFVFRTDEEYASIMSALGASAKSTSSFDHNSRSPAQPDLSEKQQRAAELRSEIESIEQEILGLQRKVESEGALDPMASRRPGSAANQLSAKRSLLQAKQEQLQRLYLD